MRAKLIAALLISTVGALLLSSCTNVQLKDHELCGSLAVRGAACYHIFTDESRKMNLQEFAAWWNDLKDPKVATSISTITDWKGAVEKLCTDTGQCTVEVQKKVNDLYKKLSTAHSAALKAVQQ